MNIINGFYGALERARSVMFDAGTQGLGLDIHHDDISIPSEGFNLVQTLASAIGAVTDVARSILDDDDGEFEAMNARLYANEMLTPLGVLPPLATAKCPYKGLLLKVLEKKSKGVFQIQVLVLQFLERREVVKHARDLPAGWGSYQIDGLFEHARVPVTDSCFRVIDKNVWFKCFKKEDLEKYGLSFSLPPVLQDLKALRAQVRSLNQLVSTPIEGGVGFTLLTIPEKLTLNALIKLTRNLKADHKSAVIENVCRAVVTRYEDIPVKGGLVIISNGFVVGSRNKSAEEQSALLADHGCQMPRTVDAVTLVFLTHIDSSTMEKDPIYLLGKKSRYSMGDGMTRCIEPFVIEGMSHYLNVGGFSPTGLFVCLDDGSPHEKRGVVAMQRLC